MKNIDVAKLVFLSLCAGAVIGCAFLYGVIVGTYQVFPHAILAHTKNSVVAVFEERRTLTGSKPEHHLRPAYREGAGVTKNDVSGNQQELVLLSGFFEDTNELRLIRRDGSIVARWPVRYSEIFPDTTHMQTPPTTDWDIIIHGALALPDGSVVFNFEYGGLVKLDRCGATDWTLSRMTHHSVERAEGGGFWVPGRRTYPVDVESPFPGFETPLFEDTILRVSDDGKVLSEFSAAQVFYKNGLEAILTAGGPRPLIPWEGRTASDEVVHLNKIEELPSGIADDFPLFEAGDLALSFRGMNLVMVVSPNGETIRWWQIGPWLRQHDPEFKAGGSLVLFNNNIYETAFIEWNGAVDPSTPRKSNVIEFDLTSGTYDIRYGNREGQRFLSVVGGKVEVTPRGGFLITEYEGGRAFETDAKGDVIWEYVNRYDSDEVTELSEARLYPANYFTVSDWSCAESAQ